MTGIMGVISYGIGTIIGFVAVGVLVFWFIQTSPRRSIRCCAITR